MLSKSIYHLSKLMQVVWLKLFLRCETSSICCEYLIPDTLVRPFESVLSNSFVHYSQSCQHHWFTTTFKIILIKCKPGLLGVIIVLSLPIVVYDEGVELISIQYYTFREIFHFIILLIEDYV